MSINAAKEIEDRHWVEQAFFLRFSKVKEREEMTLRRTNVNLAFHDTTLGGNASMNPKYQFTRTCDPKGDILASGSKGQGLYYNEAIDQNAQRIWLQFGTMEFNSIATFLAGSYNYKMAYLANKGKAASALFEVGKVFGFLATLPLQVYFGINHIYRKASAVITGRPYSRYAYLKPAMSLYWSAATTILNKIAVNMGILPGMDTSDVTGYGKDDLSLKSSLADKVGSVDGVVATLPDVFKRTSNRLYIDLMAVSSRGQRLANQYHQALGTLRDASVSPEELSASVKGFMSRNLSRNKAVKFTTQDNYLKDYLSSYGSDGGKTDKVAEKDQVEEIKKDIEVKPDVTVRDREAGFADFALAEVRDGTAFVSFVVENQGPISDTFTNSTKSPGIEDMINGVAEQSRDMYVNFGGGNLGDGFIADAIETVIGGVSSLIAGGLDSVGLGGLAALGGSGFTEFNEVYDNSDTSMDGGSFTIKLSTPYGNKISILQDIMSHVSMLLAGVLPKATGKSSYTSPFFCRLFSPGRCDWKLAMIKSLTITRGTSNNGWSEVAHLPTSIDITLEIEDLNNVVSMPIATNMLDDFTSFSFFDEDTPFSNYLSSLSGLGLYEQYYLSGKINLALEQTKVQFDQLTNSSTVAQWAAHTTGGEIAKIFSNPSSLLDTNRR